MSRITAEDSKFKIACEVGAELTSSLVLEDVLENVARRIAQALDAWECDLYQYDPDTETIVATAAWAREMTQEDHEWIGTVWSLAQRPSYHRVLLEGCPDESYADDEEMDETDRQLMKEWGELATISVPLAIEDRVIGCLTVIEKRSVRHFSDEDKELLALLTVPAALAVTQRRRLPAAGGAGAGARLPARLEPDPHLGRRARGHPGRGLPGGGTGTGDGGVRHLRVRPAATRTGSSAPSTRGAGRGRRGPDRQDLLDRRPAGRPGDSRQRGPSRSTRCQTPACLRTCASRWRSGARRPASTSRCCSRGTRSVSSCSSRRSASARSRPTRWSSCAPWASRRPSPSCMRKLLSPPVGAERPPARPARDEPRAGVVAGRRRRQCGDP